MLVGLDTETCPTTEFDKAPPLVCVSYAIDGGKAGLYRWDEAKQFVAECLSHHTIVGANIAFDIAVLLRQWPEFTELAWQAYEEDRIIDILVDQKLIEIADVGRLYTFGSYGLKDLAKQYLGRELDKETYRLNYTPLREVPLDLWPEGARKYAIDDATATLDIHRLQKKMPDRFNQFRHAWWIHLMGVWGIRTDLARVNRFHQSLLTDADRLIRTVLQPQGLIRLEKKGWVRNEKNARAYMEKVWRDAPRTPASRTYPRGQIKIDEIACLDSGDPVMVAYSDYASVKKQLSGDIPHLLKGEIHSYFGSLITSGRIECSGFNLTNPPREGLVRPCMVPRPGKCFIDSDYVGLEAFTGAQGCIWLVGDSDMADVLRAGEDIHLHMAAALMNISFEDACAKYAAGDKYFKIQRQFAKIANYGLAGGMEDETFFKHAQKELKKARAFDLARNLTFGETSRIRQTWLERWREWPHYFSINQDLTRWGDYQLEQFVSGRLRLFSGGRAYTELNNGRFQGLGADAAKAAGWQISRECYDPSRRSVLFGSRPVNFCHDQFLVETDPEIGHDTAMRVKALMEGVSEKWCPDVPLRTEPCLADAWFKGAEALTDANGRLKVSVYDEMQEAA